MHIHMAVHIYSTLAFNITVYIVISHASCSYYMHAAKPVEQKLWQTVVVVAAAATTFPWHVDDAAT